LEVELSILAERYHTTPSAILEEEDELIYTAAVGLDTLRALQACDRAMEKGGENFGEGIEAEMKIMQKVQEAMKNE